MLRKTPPCPVGIAVLETSLHQQLKDHYARPGSRQEVTLGRYRIDLVQRGRLIEIQQSGLGAIRDKVRDLLQEYRVDLVKPLVVRKRLVRLDGEKGTVVSRRWSPLRGKPLDVFTELLHFSNVFPHPRLRLLTPMIEVEESRFPGHGRRRRWRKNDFVVGDLTLTGVLATHQYRTVADLCRLIPAHLPVVFHTRDLAGALGVRETQSRQIAWVLRQTGAADVVGKNGNRKLYRLNSSVRASRAG